MKNSLILLAVFIIGVIPVVYADVFVPGDEILGYFDSNDIYTVVGAVKNTENYPVLSVLHLSILENQKEITITQKLPAVFPDKDIPFKIKIPEITDHNASIIKFEVTFEKIDATPSGVEVVYDRSLTKHSDGHLSGKIMNKGNLTEHNIKVYATVHGQNNSFIDVAKNLEKIEKIEPGQTLEFTMYPDPSVAKSVHYYSCFVLGDETIVPVTAFRNGEKFNFRYDSPAAAFVVVGFDETGTKLALRGINSFKFPTYVNFEFPKISENEKFEVLVNKKPVKFIQSQDEAGNWHVAFDVEGTTQNQILISGFENPRPQKTVVSDDLSDIPLANSDYSFLYYAIPIISAAIIMIYAYVRKKAKISTI